MNKNTSEAFDFAPNASWMSSKATNYIPRNMSEVGRRISALYLMRTDDGFKHLLRQCRDKWIVALTVGKRTAHSIIYDHAAFVDKNAFRGSSAIAPGQTTVLVVDRLLNMDFVPKEDEVEATSTGGLLYASRCLTDFEIGLLDSIGRNTIDLSYGGNGRSKVLTFNDADIEHMAMITMSITSRRWSNSLDGRVEEIFQADRLQRL